MKSKKNEQPLPVEPNDTISVSISEEDGKTLDTIDQHLTVLRARLGETREQYLRNENALLEAISKRTGELNSLGGTLMSKYKLDAEKGPYELNIAARKFIARR